MSLTGALNRSFGESPSSSRIFPGLGDQAPDCVLASVDGKLMTLSSFWTRQTTVLVFLRHFGCPFCREQVAMLRRDYLKFQAAGAEIVCIGQGPYQAGKAFFLLMDIKFPVLVCGEDLAIYEMYGLGKASLKQLIGINVLKRGIMSLRRGIGLGAVKGDASQMPGIFVVNSSGSIILAHRNSDQADNIATSKILDVLR